MVSIKYVEIQCVTFENHMPMVRSTGMVQSSVLPRTGARPEAAQAAALRPRLGRLGLDRWTVRGIALTEVIPPFHGAGATGLGRPKGGCGRLVDEG